MAYPAAAGQLYEAQRRRKRAILLAMRHEWASMGVNWEDSWRVVGPRLTVLLAAAQLGAARDGVNYVPTVLAETGQTAPPVASPVAASLAGIAADGRALQTLLYGAVAYSVKESLAGESAATALARGQRYLDLVTNTEVADAARGGSRLGMVARPKVTGWIRMINAPACPRCAILAGRWYRWNADFRRHPRCDCLEVPATPSQGGRVDPKAMLANGEIQGFTKTQRRQLDEGVNLNTVANSRRNDFTRTKVEKLYGDAPSRDEAINRLTRAGYLT